MSEDHDWVRRLLAEEGRAPEPMPPGVADRLDRVLEKQAEPVDRGHQRVLPMTPRRQRRWAGALLAAAALTVGGYSLTATGALDGFSGSAGSEATSGGSARDAGGGADADQQVAEAAPDSATRAGGGREGVLSSQTLRRDVARLVAADARATRPPGRESSSLSSAPGSADCVPPPVGLPGSRLAVSLDGRPATAVVRLTKDDDTVVTVWDCGSPHRLARVTVPR